MYQVTVRSDFKAAHQLAFQGGKCESLHGHNWGVEVTVESERLNNWGAVVDFALLKTKLEALLLPFDHKRLNFTPPFDKENPTAERLARFIADSLQADSELAPVCRVARVVVSESPGFFASYTP